ncbi:MAG: NADH-quinone oxidoreductase subunit J [Chloroflexota bacterium]|nr:NADH-quinone oxidoreductase subunit J [Chloroflexota bacterium]
MFDVIEPIVFAVLSIAIVGAGAAVVLLRRITSGALLMAFTFLSMAGMFVLLGAETIAAFQVLIYVGAITVLILYGVMFTPQSPRSYPLFFQRQTPLAAIFVAVIAVPVVVIALSFHDGGPPGSRGGDLVPLATSLFGPFAFPFEVASVLLLAAMIGAIALVKREDPSDVDEFGEEGS